MLLPMALHPVLQEKLHVGTTHIDMQAFTRRDVQLPIIAQKVHAVIGMRRAGKTIYLRQRQQEWQRNHGAESGVYINFDDDRLSDLPLEQLDLMLEEFYRTYPRLRAKEVVHWFFDEVQLVHGWERFVRRLLDTEKVEIIVSGSSAKLLSREVHTSLRGRGIETIIRPFSFREFLRYHRDEPSKAPHLFRSVERSLIEKRFRDYLVIGGFPEAQELNPLLRIELLQGYVDTLIYRDVVERFRITQVTALRWLVRHTMRNPASLMSIHRLHQDLKAQGLGISKDMLHALLGHLIDAFLLSTVPIATDSERRRNSNPRKVYPVDVALIRAFDRSGRPNIGHALETVVFNELERRKAEVAYVKTTDGYEVDFYARYLDGKEELIQVCADLHDAGTKERELRALVEAKQEYRRAKMRLLVLNFDQVAGIQTKDILVQPTYQWLLEKDNQH